MSDIFMYYIISSTSIIKTIAKNTLINEFLCKLSFINQMNLREYLNRFILLFINESFKQIYKARNIVFMKKLK